MNKTEYKKAGADGLMGAMPANEQGEGPLQYSEKLSPAVNQFLAQASRQDVRLTKSSPGGQWIVPQVSPDTGTLWKRVSPISNSSSSPSQPQASRTLRVKRWHKLNRLEEGETDPLKRAYIPCCGRNWSCGKRILVLQLYSNFSKSLRNLWRPHQAKLSLPITSGLIASPAL